MATVLSPPEQKIVLNDVSWETYQQLLTNYQDSSSPRLTYDRGVLEIMSPSQEHETTNYIIELMVEIIAEEIGIDVLGLGSTTFKREDLKRGFEPDSCFYIQNEARVRGKDTIDLAVDPPPDLVIEIDITHSSLSKLPIYAQLGVPEVWRYNGEKLLILQLVRGEYAEREASAVLSFLTGLAIFQLVEKGKLKKRTAWLRELRAWVQNAMK